MVATGTPSNFTVEIEMKPEPFTVRVKSEDPADWLVGLMEVMAGEGNPGYGSVSPHPGR